nr:MAG TPA: hypothetical protein [Bacteriophage sp.]
MTCFKRFRQRELLITCCHCYYCYFRQLFIRIFYTNFNEVEQSMKSPDRGKFVGAWAYSMKIKIVMCGYFPNKGWKFFISSPSFVD